MNLSLAFGKTSPAAYPGFQKKAEGAYTYLHLSQPSLDKYKSVFNVPTLVGIEIEVENVKHSVGGLPSFWTQETDGSLRNGGQEFKSAPLNAGDAFTALDLIWKVFNNTLKEKPDFSWRSSIHFHINAMDLESEEMRRWIALSLIFEGLFFHVAGEAREQSNFCVPLCRSTLMIILRQYLQGKVSEKKLFSIWNAGGGADSSHGLYKYAAINFSRLGDLGTVEFRHLGGTNKLPTVMLFLAMILSLYKAAVGMSSNELSEIVEQINLTKGYTALVKKIFGQKVYEELGQLDYESLIAGNALKVKGLMCKPVEFSEVHPDSSLGVLAEGALKRQAMLKKGGKALKK